MEYHLYNIHQTCLTLNLGKTNLYKLINSGKIQAVKIGKKTLISKDELSRYVASLTSYPAKQDGVKHD